MLDLGLNFEFKNKQFDLKFKENLEEFQLKSRIKFH